TRFKTVRGEGSKADSFYKRWPGFLQPNQRTCATRPCRVEGSAQWGSYHGAKIGSLATVPR
ncbi:hypothetical protein HAX54_027938, partial [Datura stramonium]|nr:hypothetical protein [Datura stramonium]